MTCGFPAFVTDVPMSVLISPIRTGLKSILVGVSFAIVIIAGTGMDSSNGQV
jgi:hypothetical protein